MVVVIDMGWVGIKVGVDYEGDYYWIDCRMFNKDIKCVEVLIEFGWIDVCVMVEDIEGGIIWWVLVVW